MIPGLKARASLAMALMLAVPLPGASAAVWAEPAPTGPDVEITKHSTGKEATVRQGEKEWFIHVDVDQDRTMIIRTESVKGQEVQNQPEIIDRPMSSVEVDHVINDFVSGIKSTLKP